MEVKIGGEEVKVGNDKEEGLDKILKRWGRQSGRVFVKLGAVGTPCQLLTIKSYSGKRVFCSLRKILEKTCEGVQF